MRSFPGTLLLVAVLAVASCGSASDKAVAPAADPIKVDGITWVHGHTFGDATGALFEVSPTPESFVVGGNGLYFSARKKLYYATAGDVTRVRGTRGFTSSLASSPDHRWVAFIDFGPSPAQAVVIDTRSGHEVLRTAKDMGSEKDDLTDLYEEDEPGIRQVTDEVVWIDAPYGYVRYDVGSDQLEDLGKHPFPETGDGVRAPWTADRSEDNQSVWNSSRTWLLKADNGGHGFDGPGGLHVEPSPKGGYQLFGWTDDQTAYGVRAGQLVSCTAPAFTCTDVPGAAGPGTLLPSDSDWNSDAFLR